jgi:hypothetical protein
VGGRHYDLDIQTPFASRLNSYSLRCSCRVRGRVDWSPTAWPDHRLQQRTTAIPRYSYERTCNPVRGDAVGLLRHGGWFQERLLCDKYGTDSSQFSPLRFSRKALGEGTGGESQSVWLHMEGCRWLYLVCLKLLWQ